MNPDKPSGSEGTGPLVSICSLSIKCSYERNRLRIICDLVATLCKLLHMNRDRPAGLDSRQAIMSCTALDTLGTWLDRSLTAAHVSEIFD
jgi:hypothetical protein